MGYIWDIFGISLEYLGNIWGISLGYLWVIFGISLGYLLSERTSGVPPVIFVMSRGARMETGNSTEANPLGQTSAETLGQHFLSILWFRPQAHALTGRWDNISDSSLAIGAL